MLIVVGATNVDFVTRTERLPVAGETVLGDQFLQTFGGKAANQAVAAARLGGDPVTLVSALGDDPLGQQCRQRLCEEGIVDAHLRIMPKTATGVAMITVDAAGENSIVAVPGANLGLTRPWIERLPDAIFREAKVVVGTFETPVDALQLLFERARDAGAITLLNPAPAIATWTDSPLPPLVDLVTPNQSEAAALSGIVVQDRRSAGEAGRQLLGDQVQRPGQTEKPGPAVIVTLGSDGCLIVQPGGEPTHVPAPTVTAVDTTAAGDAFNGALAVALARGSNLIDATRWANRAASISVTRAGAQPSLPTLAEM